MDAVEWISMADWSLEDDRFFLCKRCGFRVHYPKQVGIITARDVHNANYPHDKKETRA
jgi:CBS domain-containing protein